MVKNNKELNNSNKWLKYPKIKLYKMLSQLYKKVKLKSAFVPLNASAENDLSIIAGLLSEVLKLWSIICALQLWKCQNQNSYKKCVLE